MSTDGKEPSQPAADAPGDAPKKKSLGPLLVPLLNTVAVLGTLGFLYYSKMIFKRPKITEESERAKLAQIHASPTPPPLPGLVQFETMTINMSPGGEKFSPTEEANQNLSARLHYVTFGFALEIRDLTKKEAVESLKPFILDKVISIIGKKQTQDVNTIQGRYVLHSQMIDLINQVVATRAAIYVKEGLVTNIYFTEFIVQ